MKELALWNMALISVTLPTFQAERSPLKLLAERNMELDRQSDRTSLREEPGLHEELAVLRARSKEHNYVFSN